MDYLPRKFEGEEKIIFIGEGLLDKSLPKKFWTHEAHFAATVYLLVRKPEINLEVQMPKIIFDYNIASGGENTDTKGYHETLTQFYIKLVRAFLAPIDNRQNLVEICNRLVTSSQTLRDFPLKFYSKELLFSVNARRNWVEPDLAPLRFNADAPVP